MKKVYQNLPTFIFAIFIVVMFVLFLVIPKKEYSSSEKRYLEQAPPFTVDDLLSGEFGERFEKFLSDQFAGRNMWVGLAAYYNCGIGNNGANGIYKCSDGYLINDPEDMSGLMRNIDFIEEFAEHTDADTYLLLAPSTGYICDDVLPAVHLDYTDDEMFARVQDALNKTRFIDIRDAFKDAYADGRQMYYKTDHHWTSFGAYTAYRELSSALGYTPHDIGDYEISVYGDFYGTTYSSSGFWLNEPDQLEVWDNKANDGDITVAITDNGETYEQEDMFFYSHLDEDDKYPVYLDGNHPYTVITNENATSDEKLLIVKDSFAHSLTPFIADHYGEIIMVDMRYYSYALAPLIESEGIDTVLFVYSIDNLATDDRVAFIE